MTDQEINVTNVFNDLVDPCVCVLPDGFTSSQSFLAFWQARPHGFIFTCFHRAGVKLLQECFLREFKQINFEKVTFDECSPSFLKSTFFSSNVTFKIRPDWTPALAHSVLLSRRVELNKNEKPKKPGAC
jgi:hypothetical protein